MLLVSFGGICNTGWCENDNVLVSRWKLWSDVFYLRFLQHLGGN